MNVYHDLKHLPKFRNAVITIGSFDGVHCGHQRILEQVKALAKAENGESIVITFHPHPRLVLAQSDNTNLALINSIEEKINLLRRYEVDNVVVVPFTKAFSEQRADEYIEDFLHHYFQPKYIVIGYDHRFGHDRQGDIDYLKWYGNILSYDVVEIKKQEVEEIAVSSTKIRTALAEGDVKKAHKLLGHYFTLTGIVVHGQKIGTTIGYPTANLKVNTPHKLVPPDGIYAVYCWHKQDRYYGMLYIGQRPTVEGYDNRTIEVNIFNFDKNIYGDKLTLELVDFIRDDEKFDDLEGLQVQLKADKKQVLDCLTFEDTYEDKRKEKNEPLAAVVILNYNGKDFLAQFLPSVLDTTYSNFKVIVADNGSTDGSLEFMSTAFPDVECLDLEENWGFAEGYNQALKQVEAEYFVLLNSDVEVTRNWLTPIIELMERDPTVAACQPKILAFDQKDQFEYAGAAGGWMDRWGYPFCRGRIFSTVEKDLGQYDDTQEVFWASGAVLFIRAKLFQEIGGFDGDYFAHLEEIDLCWRLKRAGYKIMVRPKSVVYHVGGGTLSYASPRKTYLNFRNSLFTIVKNEPLGKVLWLIPWRLVLDGFAGVLFLAQFQFSNIAAIFKAHWYFIPRIGQAFRKRRTAKVQVDRVSISTLPNMEGMYQGSIVWQYYAGGKKYFRNLKAK